MKLIVILTLVAITCYSQEQANRKEVADAVLNYVDAFYFGDTAKIHQSISPDVVKYGYFKKKNTIDYTGEPMSFREMISYASRVKIRGASPKVMEFPKEIQVFDVLDQTASARLKAWWGIDYILLAKQQGEWKITHVLWQSTPSGD